ncbi:hypothetical protein RHGRI_011059 [Rhododendron griersonianum]|uniref:Uncharacterized protein n=1 Tax=Rhododendron griersonianum TaxID=479676 RepID=A0AAV6KL85_9ERIC|nr:hypothetical protein RHGRI_011059 [Rhododendron griersonianum]
MSVQEVPIAPTLEQVSTNHIAGRIVRERSYSSSSSSSPKFLVGVDEDNAANNNWDQYASSHSTSLTSNWEVKHVNPPTDRDLSGNLFNAFFIPNSQSPETPILGPAFYELPLAFTVHYPVFEECKILRDNDDLDWVNWDFTISPSTTLQFTQWWHNSMTVYNGTSLAKAFLQYINAIPSTTKNIASEGSETFSNDGFGDIEPSDGEKEVEQPMLVAAIPLQVVPPPNTFRRKKHTRTLVSIFEEPSKTLSFPKRRKALITDSDEDTVSYPGTGRVTRSRQAIKEQERAKEEEKEKQEAELDDHAKLSNFARKRPSHRSLSTQTSDVSSSHQSLSHEVPIAEPIIEENPNTMVDLNQVRNQENSSEPLHLEVSNVGNPVDSLPTVPETPLSEYLETPISWEIDKSVHAPTEVSPSLVDTSIPETV